MILLFIIFYVLYVCGVKWKYFRRLEHKVAYFHEHYWGRNVMLNEIFDYYKVRECESIESIFVSGFQEFLKFPAAAYADAEMVVNNCRRAMEVRMAQVIEEQEDKLAQLASFGATCPYIGLVGTVIGILTSFSGLAQLRHVTLNTVAPGISEALIATAFGLCAAIPAVLAYNYFLNRSNRLIRHYEALSDELCNILMREMKMYAHQARRQG